MGDGRAAPPARRWPPRLTRRRAARALPAATCGRVFYGGRGVPDRLIVSDMPLRGGGALPTPQMSEAIAYVLRQRGFRAGRLRIGYQSCDDSTAQAGIFDEAKCAANAKLYATHDRGDRRDRPVQLGLRVRPDPDRQPRRPGDDLAHELRHRPDARDAPHPRRPRRVAVSDRRAQLRPHLPPRGGRQGAAAALFARRMSGRTASPSSATADTARCRPPLPARRPRTRDRCVCRARLEEPEGPQLRPIRDAVARDRPDAVYVAGLLDSNGDA